MFYTLTSLNFSACVVLYCLSVVDTSYLALVACGAVQTASAFKIDVASNL